MPKAVALTPAVRLEGGEREVRLSRSAEARAAWARAIELKNDPRRDIAEGWALFCRVFGVGRREIDWGSGRVDMNEVEEEEDW